MCQRYPPRYGRDDACPLRRSSAGPEARILFQLVPEHKTVKNRLNDLRIGADDVQEVVDRLTTTGATFLHQGQQGPHTWLTIADPEGNLLCVSK